MLHHNTKGCSGLNAASQERLKVEIAKLWLSLLLPAEVWGAHLKATCVGKCRHASERQNILKLPNRSSYQRYLPVQQASVTTIHRGCCREEFNKLVWPSWGQKELTEILTTSRLLNSLTPVQCRCMEEIAGRSQARIEDNRDCQPASIFINGINNNSSCVAAGQYGSRNGCTILNTAILHHDIAFLHLFAHTINEMCLQSCYRSEARGSLGHLGALQAIRAHRNARMRLRLMRNALAARAG
eukprot:1137464-Pelagomonas_calceolata.AAC.6